MGLLYPGRLSACVDHALDSYGAVVQPAVRELADHSVGARAGVDGQEGELPAIIALPRVTASLVFMPFKTTLVFMLPPPRRRHRCCC